MVNNHIVDFWVMTYLMVGLYQHFEGTYSSIVRAFYSADGWNINSVLAKFISGDQQAETDVSQTSLRSVTGADVNDIAREDCSAFIGRESFKLYINSIHLPLLGHTEQEAFEKIYIILSKE